MLKCGQCTFSTYGLCLHDRLAFATRAVEFGSSLLATASKGAKLSRPSADMTPTKLNLMLRIPIALASEPNWGTFTASANHGSGDLRLEEARRKPFADRH